MNSARDVNPAADLYWLDVLLLASQDVQETAERRAMFERAELLTEWLQIAYAKREARARKVRHSVRMFERREYLARLAFLGDCWNGDACTDPSDCGRKYMQVIRRYARLAHWASLYPDEAR